MKIITKIVVILFFLRCRKARDTSDNESASDVTVLIEEMTETLS